MPLLLLAWLAASVRITTRMGTVQYSGSSTGCACCARCFSSFDDGVVLGSWCARRASKTSHKEQNSMRTLSKFCGAEPGLAGQLELTTANSQLLKVYTREEVKRCCKPLR